MSTEINEPEAERFASVYPTVSGAVAFVDVTADSYGWITSDTVVEVER